MGFVVSQSEPHRPPVRCLVVRPWRAGWRAGGCAVWSGGQSQRRRPPGRRLPARHGRRREVRALPEDDQACRPRAALPMFRSGLQTAVAIPITTARATWGTWPRSARSGSTRSGTRQLATTVVRERRGSARRHVARPGSPPRPRGWQSGCGRHSDLGARACRSATALVGLVHAGRDDGAGGGGDDGDGPDRGGQAEGVGDDPGQQRARGEAGVAPQPVDADRSGPPGGMSHVADRGEQGRIHHGGAGAEEDRARGPRPEAVHRGDQPDRGGLGPHAGGDQPLAAPPV
jgi:hypothetical protein